MVGGPHLHPLEPPETEGCEVCPNLAIRRPRTVLLQTLQFMG